MIPQVGICPKMLLKNSLHPAPCSRNGTHWKQVLTPGISCESLVGRDLVFSKMAV